MVIVHGYNEMHKRKSNRINCNAIFTSRKKSNTIMMMNNGDDDGDDADDDDEEDSLYK